MQLNRTRIVGTILAAGLATLALGGCATIGGLTDSEDAAGRVGCKWDVEPVQIDPPTADRRSLYVQFQDASGRGVEMRNELRREFEERGYEISMNPDTADYKVQVTIVSFDRREAGDRRDGTSHVIEGTTRGMAGQAGDSIASGGILGTALDGIGSLFGEGAKNRTTAKEWCLVASVTMAQRKEGGVATDLYSSHNTTATTYSGRSNASGYNDGRTATASGKQQYYSEMKNHLEFKSTLTAFSTKSNLKEPEARKVLIPRLVEAAANVLPSAI
jgi:hypothetical protein